MLYIFELLLLCCVRFKWFYYFVYISVDYVILYTLQLVLLCWIHFSWFCYVGYILVDSVIVYIRYTL